MNIIVPPLRSGDNGLSVANLQDALLVLLEQKKILQPINATDLPAAEELKKLTDSLGKEREQSLFGKATLQLLIYFQVQQGLGDKLRGVVETTTAAKLNELLASLGLLDDGDPLVVRGTVQNADKQPIRGAAVRAFDRDLRKEQPIGDAVTDDRGEYRIAYNPAAFASGDVPGAASPRLIVRAFVGDQQIGDAVSRPRPTRDEVVDFKTPAPSAPVVSEWENLSAGILPLLEGQGKDDQTLLPWDVNESDLGFIFEETGLEREKIRLWVLAFTVGRDVLAAAKPVTNPVVVVPVRVDPANRERLSGFAIFYGWFRLGLPGEPSALWTTPTETLVATLSSAIAQGIIPVGVGADGDGLRKLIGQIKADRVLQAPVSGSATRLGDLLAVLPTQLDLDQQRTLAAAVTDLRPEDPQLRDRIAKLPGFAADGVAAGTARTLRLGALTAGHLPLIRALQERTTLAKETEGTLSPLAVLRPDEWLDLAYTHGTPDGLPITPVAYADALAGNVERMHPTAALAAHFTDKRRLARHPVLADVGTFLSDNTDFDIATANLNAVTDQAKLDNIPEPQHAQLVTGLRSLQRMNALGATWDETAALLEKDLYSPHQLLTAGPAQLTARLKGRINLDRATALFRQAQDLHSTTLAAFTAAFSPLSAPRPFFMNQFGFPGDDDGPGGGVVPGNLPPGGGVPNTADPTGSVELAELADAVAHHLANRDQALNPGWGKVVPSARAGIQIPDNTPHLEEGPLIDHQPTLQALFGSQDGCACKHCDSVLGPAAYFVDVLEFIKHADSGADIFNRLQGRRPDLQDIELSCNNTNTEVPAIDLVLEILENTVAFPLTVDLEPGTNIADQLVEGQLVGEAVKRALKRTLQNPPDDIKLRAAKDGSRGSSWTVVDGHRRWNITAQPQGALKASTESTPQDTSKVNLAGLIAALDRKEVTKDAEGILARMFAVNQTTPPDYANYAVTITPLTKGKSWRVEYQFVGQLITVVDVGLQIVLQTPAGVPWWSQTYSEATLTAVKVDLANDTAPLLVKRLVAARFVDATELTVVPVNATTVTLASTPSVLTLNFTPAQLTIASLTYQSGDPDADPVAWPENHNPVAYEKLKGDKAIFPWSLPVDLPLEEVRLFLERARSSRRELIELSQPVDQPLGDASVFANEVLGLCQAEADLITTGKADPAIYDHWGLSSGQKKIWDAAVGGFLQKSSPLSLLQNVSILLQQSRLSFEELQAALATRFVRNGSAALVIEPQDTCKPSEMTVPALTALTLDRCHRFIRIWRKLGWTMREVDLAIQAFGGELTPDALTDLARLQRLRQQLALPVSVVVGSLHLLETQPWTDYLAAGATTHPSVYFTVFQREAVRGMTDFANFVLEGDGQELNTPNLSVSTHADYIGACLRIKPSVIAGWVSGTDGLGIEDKLNLANLSRLNAAATLCRALNLDPEKLARHLKLYGGLASLFQSAASPHDRAEAMLQFVGWFQSVQRSGLELETLGYLLQHLVTPGSGVDLDPKQLTALAEAARDAVQSIPDAPEKTAPGAPAGSESAEARTARENAMMRVTRENDALALATHTARANAVIAAIAALLGKDGELVDELLRGRLRHPANPNRPAVDVFLSPLADFIDASRLTGKLSNPAEASSLSAYLWSQFSSAEQQVLTNPASTPLQQQATLVPVLNRVLQGASIYNPARFLRITLSAETSALNSRIPPVTGAELIQLNRLLLQDAYPLEIAGRPSVDTLFVAGEVAAPDSAAVKSVLVRLYKATLLCEALKVSRVDLPLLRKSPADPQGLTVLDFNALPATENDPGVDIAGFNQLLALVQLRGIAPGAGDLLQTYAALNFADSTVSPWPDRDGTHEVLMTGFALTRQEVEAAATQLHLTTASQYRDPLLLARLITLLAALKQLGTAMSAVNPVSAPADTDPRGFISESPNEGDARAARELLRGKYGESQWHDLIKPIADPLRERQRDALVDYLIGDSARAREGDSNSRINTGPRFRDANDLYEYYLIDVQIGSCLKTTRLLLATAAAQLFVQRVLLNLEANVSLTEDKRKLWDWMHNYRVWEANRKVFLYPENWLLPELRDDKTATFRQMEGALTETEPSPETTRAALLGYLEQLGDLAQVSVIAMFQNVQIVGRDSNGSSIVERVLYVVGRTPNEPHYFWRSCNQFGETGMSWSGWEPLDLDNGNDFIMPFVFEGDLHVAWPIFRKTTEKKKELPDSTRLLWEVQIAWTRRTNKGWVKRKIGKAQLDQIERLPNKDEAASFAFRFAKIIRSVPGSPFLKRETVTMDCYAAVELVPIPNLTPDPSLLLNTDPIGSDPSNQRGHNYQWNVSCVVQGIVYKFFDRPVNDGGPFYQGYEDISVSLLGTQRQSDEFTTENLPEYVTTTRSDGTFKFTFSTSQTGRNGKEGLLNGGSFKLRIEIPGQVAFEKTVKLVKEILGQPNEYALDWNWTINYGVRDDGLRKLFDEKRQVKRVQSGSFVIETGKDLEAKTATEHPEYVPDLDGFALNNNLVAVSLQTPLSVVRATQSLGPVVPDIWSIKTSDNSSYYLQISNGKWHLWADGQPFVSSYRIDAASSAVALFRLENQEHLHLDPDANNFDSSTAYANYNRELFLHVPLALADYLASEQRFEDARRWLHVVFDPTTAERDGKTHAPQFWRFLEFKNAVQPAAIADVLVFLADPKPKPGDSVDEIKRKSAVVADLKYQIEQWKQNPFMPHAVARLRPSAYQWSTFFSYLEVLIGWGDQLFRRDTRESVNDATLLYVLAAKLLGPRPRTIPAPTPPYALTYRLLPRDATGDLADFSNAWVDYADLPGIKQMAGLEPGGSPSSRSFALLKKSDEPGNHIAASVPDISSAIQHVASLSALAFCIPQNDRITEFYDRIENRLFNVRNCRNIEGVFRELPLYAPPIDPLLLIRARAAGLSIDSVIADLSAPVPNYRFNFTLQKALELCGELKALGGGLLAVMEKQDAENLALLRSRQEIALLKLVRDSREQQIAEAEANIAALQQSGATILERFGQYQKLLGKTGITNGQDGLPVIEQSSSLAVSTDTAGAVSGLGLTRHELDQLGLSATAHDFTQVANEMHFIAGILSIIPNFWAGDALVAGQTFGGANLANAASAIGKAIEMQAVDAGYFANQAGIFAGYERRQDEWVHQSKLALAELKQIQKQILAAEIRRDLAQRELNNHDTQIENAQEADDFMRSKFTNAQLYRWTSSRLGEVYFRVYQLALDQARRAETAYRFELGLQEQDSNFIQAGNWDSSKKGLVAGEKLTGDLRRMEAAYLEKNRREFELTRHVSLRQLNPLALLQLKLTGTCQVNVPEWLFDLDCPGHYFRRLKNVGLSIPAVTGPYTSVHCSLSLTESWVRMSAGNPADNYERLAPPTDDPRFVHASPTITAIVTSTGSNDTGVFETNLRDERFLPFEGAGAESTWKLELPTDFPQFDYQTIADVILHLRYTARPAPSLKSKAIARVQTLAAQTGQLALLFSLRHDFPSEWAAFVNGTGPFTATIRRDFFPYFTQGKTIHISKFEVYGSDPAIPHSVGAPVDLTVAQPNAVFVAAENTTDPKILVRTSNARAVLIVNYHIS